MDLRFNWILIVSAITISSCKEKTDNRLQVIGEVKNFQAILTQYPGIFRNDSGKVYLYEIPFGTDAQPVQLDSAVISPGATSFKLNTETKREGLYDVLIENGPMIPLINDANNISLELDLTNSDKYYTVSGSEASQKLHEFIFSYSRKSNESNKAFKMLDSLKISNAPDSVLIAATDRKNNSFNSVNNYLKEFMTTINNPTVAAFVLGTASNSLPANEFEVILNKMVQRYPSDPSLTSLKKQFDERKSVSAQAEQKLQQNSWKGKPAPELILPDVNGKNISLSSFKGKYVLVDFWASWCSPCRAENPNVVKAYSQFKNKNFTILGVSLDKEKSNWLEAIQQDQLNWTQVSDLAYWNSKAVEIFQFQGIPYNVLIDPQGTIIGEGLRGDQLFSTLNEVLK